MIPEIASAVGAAAEIGKMAKSLISVERQVDKNAAVLELQSAIIDLNQKLMEVQSHCDTLAGEKRKLELQLAASDEWKQTASKYELLALSDNIFVYVLKAGGPEPQHYVCPQCFEEKKISILARPSAGNTNFVCHRCKLDVRPVRAAVPTFEAVRRPDRTLGLL